VGHLLYSRFWQKVLFDLGEVCTPEPFNRLFHQGMITSYAYQRANKTLVPVDEVSEPREGEFVETATGEKLTPIVAKMSKSLKNVINPDEIIAQFGADTFRLYEMYMGPLDATKPWNTKDTIGCFRFLQRAWRMAVDEQTGELKLAASSNADVEKLLHRTIAKVDNDIPRLAFNTAIAAMIEFVNLATSSGGVTKGQLEKFALILAPFAPHMAEELWSKLGHAKSLSHESFPVADPKMLVDAEVEIPISIQGKVKHKIMVPTGADRATIEAIAMGDAKVKELIAGKTVQKVIVVPGKMVNLVLG
ncbi:MAG TPA: class I tRNA ligase family protein, partial [Phycisphaerales bacterium]|nr:class I tRNA ligase family protein [Phycisphaerales bacterium]